MAPTDYRVKDVAPDLTQTEFTAILSEAGSPALPAAGAVYDYCVQQRVSPAFLLAMFRQESTFGTRGWAAKTNSWGNTRPPSFGAEPILAFDQDSDAAFAWQAQRPAGRRYLNGYRDWVDGGISTVARLIEHAPYQGLATVRQIIPVWAPGLDGNVPETYIANVLASISKWTLGSSTARRVPKPPIDDLIASTVANKVPGVGFDPMDHDREPGATVLHSMAGTLQSCINFFPLPDTNALTDFGIGQTNFLGSGFARIVQFNDIFGRREGFASGPVGPSQFNPNGRPEGDGPRWLTHIGGAGKVNEVGVSIEHDDSTHEDGHVETFVDNQGKLRVNPNAPVTVYQWSASVWLQAWLHAEVFGQSAATYDYNMHHRELCGRAFKDCPRPRIYDYTGEYQAAVKAIMRHFQEDVPYPAGGLIVNGLRLNVPPEEDVDVKEPKQDKFESYINARGETIVVANLGGSASKVLGVTILDLGASVENSSGEKFDRSIQANQFRPWAKRPS